MPTKINILSQVKGISTKTPCRVATTGNTTFSSISVIDGININNNDRVLVWQQNTSSENGIYIVSGNTNLVRALDAKTSDDFIQGMQVLVYSGNTYAGKVFYLTNSASTISK
jgi:hypothetical protein